MNRRLVLTLALLTVALGLISLTVGPAPISPLTALHDLLAGHDTTAAVILLQIRLPRTLLGLTVGATLGMAGAALQGLLRNPLAGPGILGISSSAALGAVIAFYSGLASVVPLALPLGGIGGAALAVTTLYLLAGRESSMLTLILAGMAISAFASALTSLALNLSPNPYALTEVVFWLLGSLADRSLQHVALALPFMVLGWALLLSAGRGLDALTLGEDTAASMGFRLARLRLQVIGGCAAAVGAAVAVSGTIGFVGLVVPHLLRPFSGYHPARLLGVSALGGAALTLAADILVRLLGGAHEIRLGVVTALLGAPFFLALVLQSRRSLP